MGELDLQTLDTARPPQDRAIKTFPQDRQAKRDLLLARVDEIGAILQETGGRSEDLATLAPEAVAALRNAGMFRLKLPAVLGGAEVDPVTEMLVLERLAYYDFTSAWCTMVGATGVAALGAFLPQAGRIRKSSPASCPTVATLRTRERFASTPPTWRSASPRWPTIFPATPDCGIRTSSAGFCAISTPPASIKS